MSGSQHRSLHGAARACTMRPAGIRRTLGAALVLAAVSLFVGVAAPASHALGQTRGQTPARMPPAPVQPQTPLPPPPPAPPVPTADAAIVPPTGVGLCQCISDHAERRFECLPAPAVCQSACGSTHYSFVPYANFSCPLTAQQQPLPQPPGSQPQMPQSPGLTPTTPLAQPPRTP